MWHIDRIRREGNEQITIVGGKGSNVGYQAVGDRFGPEGSRYIVYVEHVGAITLEDVGHVEGGPHYWAVKVNDSDYWYYDGEGHCALSVKKDGSFLLEGQDNHVNGAVIPRDQVEFLGSYQQTVQVKKRGFSLQFSDTQVQSFDILGDGDVVNFRGPNHRYLTTDADGRLVAATDAPKDAAEIHVVDDAAGHKFKIDDTFVRVDSKDGVLYADAKQADAEVFSVVVTTSGTVCLVTSDERYVQLAGGGSNAIKAGKLDYYNNLTAFAIGFRPATQEAVLARHGVTALEDSEMDDCTWAWVKFVWQLTAGFFLAIGLGPYMATGTPRAGVLGLLRTNPRVDAALNRLVDSLVSIEGADLEALEEFDVESMSVEDLGDLSEEDLARLGEALEKSGISITAALDVLKTIWDEGLLWDCFKMALSTLGWWAAPVVLKKIITWLFLPEEEVAEVLAGAAVWAALLTKYGLDVGNKCNV